MIYFSLSPHIYAAHFDNAIIILDSIQDKYISIIDDASRYLQLIVTSSFERDECGKFIPTDNTTEINYEQLNNWITHFIEKRFILETDRVDRKFIAPQPLVPGGLIEYRWDHKPSWKPFALASKLEIMQAFFVLAKMHRVLKRTGIQGILAMIQRAPSKCHDLRKPTNDELNRLSAAVDAASVLYPKKTFCLAWASTFVLIALKKKWDCNLEIGIQINPFYAHAWAVSSEKVIHDDPVIAGVLSVILKEPHT